MKSYNAGIHLKRNKSHVATKSLPEQEKQEPHRNVILWSSVRAFNEM